MSKIPVSILFLFSGCMAFAQSGIFETYEDSLKVLRNAVLIADNDSQRVHANTRFIHTLERALNTDDSFTYPFDSLPSMGSFYAMDRSFRIITWNLPFDDLTHFYYCYMQVHLKKKKQYKLYSLQDLSANYPEPENKSLDHTKWYGALYYKIIPFKRNGKKLYTLLGWDGNDRMTNKKIIDVVYFTGSGKPKFGASVFRFPKRTKKRVVFEYSKKAVMSVKYHQKDKRIVFDHLSPPKPELKGQFEFYGPDLSYDALQLKKGKWYYIGDIDQRDRNLRDVNVPQN